MIRYAEATGAAVEAAIDALAPTWRTRARERTERFRTAGEYAEASSIWDEVKPVFMCLQKNKCVYCETKLEGGPRARIQHDLEHFRPKRGVETWPPPARGLAYDFATGDALPQGYHLLAYHPGNYAAACKVCNTPLKANYFPIAGARVEGKDHPHEYAGERPYLVYPLGTDDEDPEDLLTFVGVEARPRPGRDAEPERWRRARVVIDFFDLNREGLQEDRARVLCDVWLAFCLAHKGDAIGAQMLDALVGRGEPHTNCARCFRRLCETDAVEAERHARVALDAIEARSR